MTATARKRGPRRPLGWRGRAALSLASFALALAVLFPAAEFAYRKRRIAEYDRLASHINARKENMFLSDPGRIEYRLRPGFRTEEAYAVGSEPIVDPGSPWSWSINEQGHRGQAPAVTKPADGVRIVFLGDSITFGMGVNDEETFPARLESLLQERLGDDVIECVNLGVPEYNLHQIAILAAEALPALRPDVVVVNVAIDDAEPERMGATRPKRRFSRTRSWFLAELASNLNAAAGRKIMEPDVVETSPQLERSFEDGNPKAALAREALGSIVRLAGERGARTLVVMHPDHDHPGSGHYRYESIHKTVKSWAKDAEAPFVDLRGQGAAALGKARPRNRAELHRAIAERLVGPLLEQLDRPAKERPL